MNVPVVLSLSSKIVQHFALCSGVSGESKVRVAGAGEEGEQPVSLCQSRRISRDLSQARGESRGLVAVGHVSSQLRAQSETVLTIAISWTEPVKQDECQLSNPIQGL